ncbi:hypothetical protein Tco_1074766, partial [Tanacetum coccineum]
YGTNALSKFSPDTELFLYPLQDKLTSRDKSLDLSAFKLSRLFFSLLLYSLSTALLNARVFLLDSGAHLEAPRRLPRGLVRLRLDQLAQPGKARPILHGISIFPTCLLGQTGFLYSRPDKSF